MNNLNENTILAFHIGRGGRFYNAGFYTFLGQHSIGDFLDGIYPPSVIDESNPDDPQWIDDYETPDAEWTSESGHSVELTNAQVKSGIGRINVDYDYDTTYTVYLKDIEQDSKEWDAIFRAYDDDAEQLQDYLRDQNGMPTREEIDKYMGCVVNFGGDPFLVETEEEAESVAETVNRSQYISTKAPADADWDVYVHRLDLEDCNATSILRGVDGSEWCLCLAQDFD